MPSPINRLHGQVNLQTVATQSDAAAAVANAILKLELKPGDDSAVAWSDGKVIITHPPASSGGGSGGGLGPCVFAGTANGAVAYFLVNCDGVAYPAIPTQSDGTPYPIANPP